MACTYTYTYEDLDRTDAFDDVTYTGGVICLEYSVDITCKGECPEGSSGDCDTPFWDKDLMVCVDFGALFPEDKYAKCREALAACDGKDLKCVAKAQEGECADLWDQKNNDPKKKAEFEKAFADGMKKAIDESGFCNCGAQSNTLQPNTIQLILNQHRDDLIKRLISKS
tara:strand:+ start:2133 stop:2639 length:507 start_codon:yes stop_codon:yes gene_type:complete